MVTVGIVAVILLILVIISKTMDILTGLFGMIGGVFAYFWLGTTDSWMTQLKLVEELGVSSSDLRTYCLILAGVGLVVFVMGILRGRKPKAGLVQQQVAETHEINKPIEPNTEEAKMNEKQEENVVEKVEKNKAE